MNDSLEKGPIERARELLGATEELTASQLHALLAEYRNAHHPDRYDGKEEQEQAKELTQTANELLPLVKAAAEQQMLALPAQELVSRSHEHEALSLRSRIIELEDELASERQSREFADSRLASIQAILKKAKRRQRKRIAKKLIDSVKPTKTSLVSLGIMGLLSAAHLAVAKFQGLAADVFSTLPVGQETAGWLILGGTVAVASWVVYQTIGARYTAMRVKEVQTTACATELFEFACDREKNNDLKSVSESAIIAFVQQYVRRTRFARRIALFVFPAAFSTAVVNSLKDVLIAHLLDRELLVVGSADKLVRTFEIKTTQRYFLGRNAAPLESDERDFEDDKDEESDELDDE